jgi:hypothetical protein
MLFMSSRLLLTTILFFVLGMGMVACASLSSPGDMTAAQPVEVLSRQAATSPTLSASMLPDLGQAPEFNVEQWLNVEQPQSLASLRGKVVLLEFWTFG